ncbi:hypothetical protein D6745_04065 [Candidatus Woesearchaeota archaeon]|nr:MAG: hypothetical protein D6745_04065 [Candidatus Woesearchaeota archaeon]
MKKKVRQSIALALITLLVFLSVETAYALSITHSPDNNISFSGSSATINWETDEASNSSVSYGIGALDSTAGNSSLVTEHSISISPLITGQEYFYQLSSCLPNDTCYVTPQYNFTPVSDDTQPPFIDFNVSANFYNNYYYANDDKIRIFGRTEPNSLVIVYVNGIVKARSTAEQTGSSGTFNFPRIELDQTVNQVRIYSKDSSNNENETTFNIRVDFEEPVLSISEIPKVIINSSEFNLTGTLSDAYLPGMIKIEASSGYNRTITNVTGSFEDTVRLGEEDNSYTITVTGFDLAGNSVSITNSTIVDKHGAEINHSSIIPPDRAVISEDQADNIDIKGKTEPNARVNLFFLRNQSGRQIGVGGASEPYNETVTADENGDFEFKDVDLTLAYGGSWPREVTAGEESTEFDQITKSIPITLTAWDEYGLKGEPASFSYTVSPCGSGEYHWNVRNLIEYQTPNPLSVERIEDGTESLSIYLEFTPMTSYNYEVIKGVQVTPICNRYFKGDRYNLSCQLMTTAGRAQMLDDQGRIWWVQWPNLRPLRDLSEFLDSDNLKSYLEAVSNEITFPLEVRVTYEYEDVAGHRKTGTQNICTEVTYTLDSARFNPSELPGWVFNEGLEFISKQKENLQKLMDTIQPLIEYTSKACGIGILARLAFSIYRRFRCGWAKWTGPPPEDQCKNTQECSSANDQAELSKNKPDPNRLSNECLEKCYGGCSSAWKAEGKLYTAYRFTCDRLFGHNAPSRWTQQKTNSEIDQALIKQYKKECDVDEKGYYLVKFPSCEEFNDAAKQEGFDSRRGCWRYTKQSRRGVEEIGSYVVAPQDKCPSSDSDKGIVWLWRVDKGYEPQSSLPTNPPKCLAVLPGSTDDRFLAPRPFSCNEYCTRISPIEYERGECMKSSECTGFGEEKIRVPAGYTSLDGTPGVEGNKKCFDPKENPGDSVECCCISDKSSEYDNSAYYDYKANSDDNVEWDYRYWKLRPHIQNGEITGWRETGTGPYLYNPYRYYAGRDAPACFGTNHLFWQLFGKENETLMLDPKDSFWLSMQCGAVGLVYKRIEYWKNFLAAMEGCLQEVKVRGDADAGLCKELMTQYVCDSMYNLISMVKGSCKSSDVFRGPDTENEENKVIAAVRTGFSAVFDGVNELGQEIGEDYNNAVLSDFLGLSEENVARKICLGALFSDWDLNWKGLADTAYQLNYETGFNMIESNRRLTNINPVDGSTTYEYRAGWWIMPGCDIDHFDIYLSCVTAEEEAKYYDNGIDCSWLAANDPFNTRGCDCLDLGSGSYQQLFYTSDRSIKQGTPANGGASKVVPSQRRFDHYKVVVYPKLGGRSQYGPLQSAEDCFSEEHLEGNVGIFYFPIKDRTLYDFIDCTFDPTGGYISCGEGAPWLGATSAHFVGGAPIEPTREQTYYEGDDIKFVYNVYKQPSNENVCLYVEVRNNAGIKVDERQGFTEEISVNGSYLYNPLTLVDNVRLSKVDEFESRYVWEGREMKEKNECRAKTSEDYTGYKLTHNPATLVKPRNNPINAEIKFFDKEADNKNDPKLGIQLSPTSKDEYSINGGPRKRLADACTGGKCTFSINDASFELTGIDFDPQCMKAAKYNVYIDSIEKPEEQDQTWIVHYELRRKPVDSNSCELSRPSDFITYMGQPQIGDIPIIIRAGGHRCERDADCSSDEVCCGTRCQKAPCKCGPQNGWNCSQGSCTGNTINVQEYNYNPDRDDEFLCKSSKYNTCCAPKCNDPEQPNVQGVCTLSACRSPYDVFIKGDNSQAEENKLNCDENYVCCKKRTP